MHHNPSYLGGLAEIEPHYFEPVTPEYLQHIVSDVPLDRGDGVRPIMLPKQAPSPIVQLPPQQGAQMKTRNFGAPCAPCQSMVRNPIAMGSPYGFDFQTFMNQIGSGQNIKDALSAMTPEQKEAVKGGVFSAASMYACENFGIGCPPAPPPAGQSFPISMPLLIGAVVGTGLLVGGIVYVATR